MHDYSCPAHLPYPHVQISASNGGLGPPHFDGCNHTLGILAPTRPLAEPRGMVCERFPWRNGLRYARVRQEGLDGHYDGERMELQRADVDKEPRNALPLLADMDGVLLRSPDPKIWEAALGKACFTTELGFQIGVFFTMVSYYWNGPYFQARVVDNFARKDYPIKFLKKVRKKYGENSKEYAAALSSNELLKKESKRGPSDLKPTSTSFPYNELKKQAASANCVDGGDSPERKTSKKRN